LHKKTFGGWALPESTGKLERSPKPPSRDMGVGEMEGNGKRGREGRKRGEIKKRRRRGRGEFYHL